jgi:hypothetical protein
MVGPEGRNPNGEDVSKINALEASLWCICVARLRADAWRMVLLNFGYRRPGARAGAAGEEFKHRARFKKKQEAEA